MSRGDSDTAAGMRGAVGRFLSWWSGALQACLPSAWRALPRRRLLLKPDGDQVAIYADDGQGLQRLAPSARGDSIEKLPARWRYVPRYWLLSGHEALRTQLILPAASAERLQAVVGFELDRYTPFSAEDAYFTARVSGATMDGQLQVALVVVPRARLSASDMRPWIEGLSGVDVADGSGQPLGVNLLPAQQRARSADPSRAMDITIAAVAVALAVCAGQTMVDNRHQAVDALELSVARQAQQARAVAAQGAQLQALVDGAQLVRAKREQRPAMLPLWEALSARLPDDTWLEKLSVTADKVEMIGQGAAPADLVPALADVPGLHNPALSSVMQAAAGSARSRFTLTADLAPSKGAGDVRPGP